MDKRCFFFSSTGHLEPNSSQTHNSVLLYCLQQEVIVITFCVMRFIYDESHLFKSGLATGSRSEREESNLRLIHTLCVHVSHVQQWFYCYLSLFPGLPMHLSVACSAKKWEEHAFFLTCA